MEIVETVQSAFIHYNSISMSLHTPQPLFSNINNRGLFRRERDSEWQDSHPFTLYLLDCVVKKKQTNHSTAIMQDLKLTITFEVKSQHS